MTGYIFRFLSFVKAIPKVDTYVKSLFARPTPGIISIIKSFSVIFEWSALCRKGTNKVCSFTVGVLDSNDGAVVPNDEVTKSFSQKQNQKAVLKLR